MSKKNKDALVLGFALFSMFFGASNLIFPPFLGLQTGKNWFVTVFAFALTAVGLTVLGVITSSKYSNNINGLSEKVGKNFAKFLGVACMISIGPLLAIPRTGATTYDISIVPIFGNSVPLWAWSIIFFALTLYFSLNETSAMDTLGKILTPVLIIMIFLIIIKAIVSPIGHPLDVEPSNFFLKGFYEGYQTMDAMGSIFMFSVIVTALKSKGYHTEKEMKEMAIKTGIIAGIGLAVVYIGLAFVGASAGSVIQTDTTTELLIKSTAMLWGNFGAYALGLAMLLACLTTSIGLTCTVANYFNETFELPYKPLCVVICFFSAIFAVMGLSNILKISVPILVFLYPAIIVLLLLNIFDSKIKNKAIYKGAVFGALIISLIQSLSMVINNDSLVNLNKFIQESFPFAKIGMPYIIPSIIIAILFSLIIKEPNIDNKLQEL